MKATNALNPGQFKGPLYHGTTFDIEGSDIRPAKHLDETKSVWGSMGHSGQESQNHAFATESEHTAWEFASQSGLIKRAEVLRTQYQNAAADDGVKDPVPDVGRVRVHTVAPHPLMRPGVYHADSPSFNRDEEHDLKEWVAPSFRVTGTKDIMPGRQGTFPTLNWNQFRSKESGHGEDMNHPSNDAIDYGHEPKFSRDNPDPERPREAWAQHVEYGTAPHQVPTASSDQMDLFSGKTVEEHAENDDSALGDYHRNNLFGRL